MRRDRTLDLFSTAAPVGDRSPPPTKQVTPEKDQRHILPRDLPAAVQHLTDRELDLLIVASLEEAKRRGRSLPSVQKEAAVVNQRPIGTPIGIQKGPPRFAFRAG